MLLICLSIGFISCKKDKPIPKIVPDIYQGIFMVNGDATTFYPLKFELSTDGSGTLIAYNNPADLTMQTGSGSYTLINEVFNADIVNNDEPGVHYLFTGNVSDNISLLGSWGTAPSNNNGGDFILEKQYNSAP
ncbi:MAG: hypothetical protein NT021_02390 [Sphingobacteriales bacterium]|nr:hypothetical protein [Sphingobacteriales bacterium]